MFKYCKLKVKDIQALFDVILLMFLCSIILSRRPANVTLPSVPMFIKPFHFLCQFAVLFSSRLSVPNTPCIIAQSLSNSSPLSFPPCTLYTLQLTINFVLDRQCVVESFRVYFGEICWCPSPKYTLMFQPGHKSVQWLLVPLPTLDHLP